MKNFYDKIILVLALLALGAGVGFYFLKAGDAHSNAKMLSQAPSGPAYTQVAVPEVNIASVEWAEPTPQGNSELELFDIFTPPKIYWNEAESKFIYELPKPIVPPPPFGLDLISINQELFRIQLEAYFEGPSGKPEDAIWQFYNSKLGESVRGHIGESFPAHGFRLDSGEVKRVIEETEGSTTVRQVPTVIITDLDDNRQITLSTGSKLILDGKLTVKMATAKPYAPEEFNWKAVGDTFSTDDASFVLKEINFDNQSVTVEKTSPDLKEPETKTLYPRRSTPETVTSKPANQPEESDSSDVFQNLFN